MMAENCILAVVLIERRKSCDLLKMSAYCRRLEKMLMNVELMKFKLEGEGEPLYRHLGSVGWPLLTRRVSISHPSLTSI